jgi:hypothetical protein
MLKRHNFLWKQLNGPQITAIMDCIWQYHVDKYERNLDYFDKLSIDNARNKQLSFIGKLMQFPRPYTISLSDYEQYLRFSYMQAGQPVPQAAYGLSQGVFDYEPGINGHDSVELDDGLYRRILSKLGNIDGFSRGIGLIDELCSDLFTRGDGTVIFYLIEYSEDNFGDIIVRVKEDPGYNLLVFQMICSVVFKTQPRVSFVIDGSISLPEA